MYLSRSAGIQTAQSPTFPIPGAQCAYDDGEVVVACAGDLARLWRDYGATCATCATAVLSTCAILTKIKKNEKVNIKGHVRHIGEFWVVLMLSSIFSPPC
jgi:hypothetical protein